MPFVEYFIYPFGVKEDKQHFELVNILSSLDSNYQR